MEVNIIAVGKVKEEYLLLGIGEFSKRLKPYTRLNIIEVNDQRIPGKLAEAQVEEIKRTEGDNIITVLPENTYTLALDVKGKPMTSPGLAKSIQNLQVRGQSSITFIIGGALGLGKNVLKATDYRLSLSHLTFTHQMARLILIEQIYRAFKIIRGEPYHL